MTDGRDLKTSKGIFCGNAADRFYAEQGADGLDGVVANPVDGSGSTCLAPSAVLPASAQRLVACATHGGDLVLLYEYPVSHDGLILRIHDQKVVATLRVPELSWPFFKRGWERPLPRFVPFVGYGGAEVVTVDLNAMKVTARARLPSAVESANASVRGRRGDRFFIIDGLIAEGHLLALDGSSGDFVAGDPRRAGWFLGDYDAAQLRSDSELARTLNAARARDGTPR